MKKPIAIILPVLGCIILGIALFRANQQIAALEQQLASTETGDSAVFPTAEPESDFQSLEQTAKIQPAVQAVTEDSAVDPGLMENTLRNQQRIMNSMATMRENPTINKMIEASQRGTVGALYADMLDYLDLNEEETRYFMDLLMFRQMEQVDFGMKLMSGQLSQEEREQMAVRLNEVNDEMLAQMETFLNSENDFEEFRFYEKTIGERMALSQLDQKLAELEQPLSDDEYRELLDLMHRQKEDYDWSTTLHDQQSTDISAERFSDENMQKHTDDIMTLNENIFAQAANLLSPEQLEAFRASLQATTDMQLAQFQMVGQLLRDQKN